MILAFAPPSGSRCDLSHPEFFAPPKKMRLRVATMGDMEGAMLADETAREVDVVMNLAEEADFYGYVLKQFAR
ncbi:hypothetical protein QW131_00465 [Roseibium salinum]|nr:hypothetical protein [Roseibium salinum]